jgi:hypothetical protein
MQIDDVFKKITLINGELQTIKSVEEMSELQKELCKFYITNDDSKKYELRKNIIDEMGDVLNTFDTLCVLLSIDKDQLEKDRIAKAKRYAALI